MEPSEILEVIAIALTAVFGCAAVYAVFYLANIIIELAK